jgi:hypothetical protein
MPNFSPLILRRSDTPCCLHCNRTLSLWHGSTDAFAPLVVERIRNPEILTLFCSNCPTRPDGLPRGLCFTTKGPLKQHHHQIMEKFHYELLSNHLRRFTEEFSVPKNKTKGECSICLQRYKTNELCSNLSCNHYFHNECLIQCIGTNATCPICRSSVFKYITLPTEDFISKILFNN